MSSKKSIMRNFTDCKFIMFKVKKNHGFSNPILFYMMSPSTLPLQFECEVFDLFQENFTRSIVLKFWVKTPINKKNFSSLIITNVELRFEPCVLNLIWKWGAKDPKKRGSYNFHQFWSTKVQSKKHPKKTKLWCLNAIIS
jgi:hypothetical protein